MARSQVLFHPRPADQSFGQARRSRTVIDVSPRRAGWDTVHFAVRRFEPGARWKGVTGSTEACLVLLSGECSVDWGGGPHTLGPRADVFGGYPHAVYLPPGTTARLTATTACEIADCRTASTLPGQPGTPRIIRPEDCGFEIRGGGNATRQIVDILPPGFAADRLLICEVYTPSGNWSSYPPHKHDVDNPPVEADLDEIYYFRFRESDGYGFQRLYGPAHDETVKVQHGDVVVVRDGYHPFVTAYGCDAYYLNVLAGSRRSMAATDDPRYAALRQTWPAPDLRVPLVSRTALPIAPSAICSWGCRPSSP